MKQVVKKKSKKITFKNLNLDKRGIKLKDIKKDKLYNRNFRKLFLKITKI